jgi:hypothetical protein
MRTPSRLAAFCLATMIAPHASAGLIGLSVFREGLYGLPDPPPDATRWIYRVYAEFTDPTDAVGGWGVGGVLGAGQIRNITADGNLGTGFINIPDDNTGNVAPRNPLTVRDWDTYVTIGVVYGAMGPLGVDGTSYLGPTFISQGATIWNGAGNALLQNGTTNPQGRADFIVLGNDTATRVLLMQLVVNAGEHVDGTVGLIWRTQFGGTATTGLMFNSIPEPSTLVPLLAISICLQRRRRF